jgi:hypothetical protein
MSRDVEQHLAYLNGQVLTLYEQGAYKEAIGHATQAYDLARVYLPEDHPRLASARNNLAELHRQIGNYACVRYSGLGSGPFSVQASGGIEEALLQ